jgi:lysyl-tRNA synthetase class II
MLEVYQAYSDYRGMMTLVKDLITHLVRDVVKPTEPDGDGEEAPRSTDGGAPAGAGAGAAARQPPTKRTQLPRAIVRFPDVSVDAAAATLEARVEWGKPAVKKDQRELVTAAVHDGGLVDALRRVVQALVDEFRTK